MTCMYLCMCVMVYFWRVFSSDFLHAPCDLEQLHDGAVIRPHAVQSGHHTGHRCSYALHNAIQIIDDFR